MKKSNCILSICVIGGIVGSIIILLVFCDYNPCILFEDFLVAVFTGCLFAVPSGLLIVNEDIKRIRNEQTAILSDLDIYFESIVIKDYDDYNLEQIESIRIHIVEIYKLLGRELDENYLKKKEREKIRELLSLIFEVCHIIQDLNKKYEEMSKKNFNDDVNDDIEHINELKNLCSKLIQEIQEDNY